MNNKENEHVSTITGTYQMRSAKLKNALYKQAAGVVQGIAHGISVVSRIKKRRMKWQRKEMLPGSAWACW